MYFTDYNTVREFVVDGDGHDYMKLADLAQKMQTLGMESNIHDI